MNYLAIIQARNGSTRLPEKVLMDLAGKPALLRTIDRVKQSKYVNEVIVATSINRENLSIIKLCVENDIRVFVGSEEDVLDRFYSAAKLLKAKYIVRVTADCPLYDFDILDWAIEQMDEEYDYLVQKQPETLPDGLDIEIIKFSALQKTWRDARLKSEREHVTQYIRNNPTVFKIRHIVNPLGDHGHERWTLDDEKDYALLKEIYEHFELNRVYYPTMANIISYLDMNPEIRKYNSTTIRDEGLLKSLENDKKISMED